MGGNSPCHWQGIRSLLFSPILLLSPLPFFWSPQWGLKVLRGASKTFICITGRFSSLTLYGVSQHVEEQCTSSSQRAVDLEPNGKWMRIVLNVFHRNIQTSLPTSYSNLWGIKSWKASLQGVKCVLFVQRCIFFALTISKFGTYKIYRCSSFNDFKIIIESLGF